jgi:hypothetical protein
MSVKRLFPDGRQVVQQRLIAAEHHLGDPAFQAALTRFGHRKILIAQHIAYCVHRHPVPLTLLVGDDRRG